MIIYKNNISYNLTKAEVNGIINFDYELVRSKRKTVSICVSRELKIVIRAPFHFKKEDAIEVLVKYRPWIEKKIAETGKRIEAQKSFCFSDGEELFYLGEKYIIGSGDLDSQITAKDGYIRFGNLVKDRRAAFEKFLKKEAGMFLKGRAAYFSDITGFVPDGIKITSAKTRWGSCSYKNGICFSYRVMLLPLDLIDYIVLHELGHIRHHNHSKKFYDEILNVMPDYKKRVRDLKKFQSQLMI